MHLVTRSFAGASLLVPAVLLGALALVGSSACQTTRVPTAPAVGPAVAQAGLQFKAYWWSCDTADRDEDGVPDRVDACPDVFGTSASASGCPLSSAHDTEARPLRLTTAGSGLASPWLGFPGRRTILAEPGGLSAAGREAKVFYDNKHWAEAVPALKGVIAGATGDAEVHRQEAQLMLAVAHYRLGDLGSAMAGFLAISKVRTHPNHGLNLAWIMGPLEDGGELDIATFDGYEASDLKEFKVDHRYYSIAAYAIGRNRFVRQKFPEALELFERVDRSAEVRPQAQRCIELTKMRQASYDKKRSDAAAAAHAADAKKSSDAREDSKRKADDEARARAAQEQRDAARKAQCQAAHREQCRTKCMDMAECVNTCAATATCR